MAQRLSKGIAQFLSDVLVVRCMHIEFMHWLLSASKWPDKLAIVLNGLGGDQWSTLPQA